jgi:hypothetical protein
MMTDTKTPVLGMNAATAGVGQQFTQPGPAKASPPNAAPTPMHSAAAPPVPKAAEGLVDQAKHAASTLIGQGKERLETSKDEVTDRAGSFSDALRGAGEKLGEHGDLLPEYVEKAASQVDRLTHYVRSRNIGELITDVEGFARREPALFLGGSFALGLFASRFLKSSGHRAPPEPTAGSGGAARNGA